MTRAHRRPAKGYESDTVPGDFGALATPCPKCGGEVHENYKKFQCQNCDFGIWKIVGGPPVRARRGRAAAARAVDRSAAGLPQQDGAAVRRDRSSSTTPEIAEFDFGQTTTPTATRRSTSPARSRWGHARSAASRVFEHGMKLRLREGGRRRASPATSARARSILQQPIERAQMQKLLATGKTDLLTASCRRARAGRSRPSSSASPTARSASNSRRAPRAPRAAAGPQPPRRCACSASTRATASRSSSIRGATAPT